MRRSASRRAPRRAHRRAACAMRRRRVVLQPLDHGEQPRDGDAVARQSRQTRSCTPPPVVAISASSASLLLFQRLHAGGGLDQLVAQRFGLRLQRVALRLGRVDDRFAFDDGRPSAGGTARRSTEAWPHRRRQAHATGPARASTAGGAALAGCGSLGCAAAALPAACGAAASCAPVSSTAQSSAAAGASAVLRSSGCASPLRPVRSANGRSSRRLVESHQRQQRRRDVGKPAILELQCRAWRSPR